MLRISNLKFAKGFVCEPQSQAAFPAQGRRRLHCAFCTVSRALRDQADTSAGPPVLSMRVWAVSDLHTDYPDNLKWSEC